jgi:hypothetical protein
MPFPSENEPSLNCVEMVESDPWREAVRGADGSFHISVPMLSGFLLSGVIFPAKINESTMMGETSQPYCSVDQKREVHKLTSSIHQSGCLDQRPEGKSV